MPDRTPQHELSEFLQLELLHSLGSYGLVARQLAAIGRRMDERARANVDPALWEATFPDDVVARTRECNLRLRNLLHKPASLRDDFSSVQKDALREGNESRYPPRHPAPPRLLTGEQARSGWLVDFFHSAVVALKAESGSSAEQHDDAMRLGKLLAFVHDPQRDGSGGEGAGLRGGRLLRNEDRLAMARDHTGLQPRDRCSEILGDHLGAEGEDRLHTQVLGALAEAHMRMHRAEHLASHSFGDQIQLRARVDEQLDRELERSLMLNTFVYVAARTAPWIFAEDVEEQQHVQRDYRRCCRTVTPTYCMWIAHQLSLLALYRRAFTWWLRGRPNKAYRDFYKVKRFVRGIENRLETRVAKAEGAAVFLHGLSALADHHTGRIYRNQHAHTAALEHFGRAERRMARIGEVPGTEDVLRNSRWRIDLSMNQGKANYELGLIKPSLLCYVRAWRAFLELADTENMAKANFEAVDGVIAWLERTRDDPDLDKRELHRQFAPLVHQFDMVFGPVHLRLLAAEIMMRLGHALFIVKLPELVDPDEKTGWRTDHGLAYRCLCRAAQLDPESTLIAGDVLKIRQWSMDPKRRKPLPEDDVPIELDFKEVANRWPAGGGPFEEAARVIEFVLQSWLDGSSDAPEEDRAQANWQERQVARELLSAFLAHTDSSNLKLAQVYQYLMRPATHRDEKRDAPAGGGDAAAPMLEFVCMRRYSSFFPFLPRPTAFRVLGGGYFVRAYDPSRPRGRRNPFGIVIDPGPNFLENLYRCGYCLDDVRMVIVTHDHADHLAGLDALLALLYYRYKLGSNNFRGEHKLLILGNESVHARYRFYNDSPGNAVRVLRFGESLDLADGLCPPAGMSIVPVETVDHTDAQGKVAQGFLLRFGAGSRRSSVLFTSDTGHHPSLGGEPGAVGVTTPTGTPPPIPVAQALEEAAIVVAHVSTIPLPELRDLAGLGEAPPHVAAVTESFQRLWDEMRSQISTSSDLQRAQEQEFLLRQLQFGFHSLALRDAEDQLAISPLSPSGAIKRPSDRHLYLSGLLLIAQRIAACERPERLLLIGELHEELGTFRTRIAAALNRGVFANTDSRALTTDIGLKARVQGDRVTVLCTTCDLDNDRVPDERFHPPRAIGEVCVKGEHEAIFHNCPEHQPGLPHHTTWLERVERYDPFGP